MLNWSEVNAIKTIAPILVGTYPQGALITVIRQGKYSWAVKSPGLQIDAVHEGADSGADPEVTQAMLAGRTLTRKEPANVYGVRMLITYIPIVDNGEMQGCLIFGVPRVNALEIAFKDLTSILLQIFGDGAYIYLTDLEYITHRCADERFDLPTLPVGYKLTDKAVATQSIKTRQSTVKEVDASMYGEVCLIGNFPLLEDNEVVGTFGIATPKRTSMKLRDMSVNMHEGMSQIAAAIEELAASSFEIHESEMNLNNNVQEISKLSNDINAILNFIKQIAEETKMLGLNAAIEAARAGEAGRGFGVVAEEIRKLSDESKETVTKIHALTGQIQNKIEETMKNSKVTLQSSQEQAAATEEVTAQVEELNGLAEELDKIAQVI